jgi:hypothetical protein
MAKISKDRGPTLRPAGYPIGMVPATDDSKASSVESSEAEGADDLARPPLNANKAEWVAYAEALDVDSSGSKKKIIARIDELE